MPEVITQPSFAAGEVGPQLYGRVDQELYYIGLRTVRNFLIEQYGGASNRPGTKIISEHKDQSKKVRLVPFTFKDQQNYVLQIGEDYTRFIKDAGEIIEAATAFTITGATAANPVVITAAGHGRADGEDIYISGILGMVELNGRTLRVANKTASTFELQDSTDTNVDGSAYSAYTSGGTGTKIYEIVTPWQEVDLFTSDDDLPSINHAQNNDVISVCHPSYYPQDITRTDHDAWTINDFPNTGGPFLDINITATTIYASAASGSGITLTASASLFTAAMVGELFYIEQEPDDTTERWEAGRPIKPNDFRRAGSHYYQANFTQATEAITGISAAAQAVVLMASGHGIQQGDQVFIDSGSDMVELNGKYYGVDRVSATQIYLTDIDTNAAINSTSFTAWTAGGTVQKCKKTGTFRPDHKSGSATDGGAGSAADSGVLWDYLHSGFGIVEIASYSSGTSVTADVVVRLPDLVVGSGNITDNWAQSAWTSGQGYPSACAYNKQRFILAATTQAPNRLWFSGVNLRANFTKSLPILDDESITLDLDTTGANSVRHLLPFSDLIALTSASEHLINGVDNVILASGDIYNKVQGYTGASPVIPIIVNNQAIFVQDMGGVIRSLQYQLQSDNYGGIDLTARSPHLFVGRKIIDWCYQRHPFSIIWVIMDDGTLLGFTFMNEQKVYAWHRHDSGASAEYESVACIREGNETAAYFAVKRTIDGKTRRYVERLSSRVFTAVRDAYFVDCGLSYDGRNTSSTTMTITGGSTWDSPEVLTITASSAKFLATDVDSSQVTFWVGDIAYRLDITAFTSTTIVSGVPTKALPASHQGVAFTSWEIARKTFQPLHHLEGETLSILSDGNIVTNKTVSNGKITLDDPGAVVHMGIGYVSDLETLDLAAPQGQSKGKTFIIPRVFLTLEQSRAVYTSTEGLNADDTLTDLRGNDIFQMKQREVQDGYDAAIPAETDVFEVLMSSTWNKKGRISIRQTLPLPVTINSITPEVALGEN